MKRRPDPTDFGPDLDGDRAGVWRGLCVGLPASLLLWGVIIVVWRLLS